MAEQSFPPSPSSRRKNLRLLSKSARAKIRRKRDDISSCSSSNTEDKKVDHLQANLPKHAEGFLETDVMSDLVDLASVQETLMQVVFILNSLHGRPAKNRWRKS